VAFIGQYRKHDELTSTRCQQSSENVVSKLWPEASDIIAPKAGAGEKIIDIEV
jgi:hypothetical protein